MRVIPSVFALWLFLPAVAVSLAAWPSEAEPPPAPRHFLSADETQAQLGQRGFEILDLRDGGWEPNQGAPPEYRKGHLPGALPFDGGLARLSASAADQANLRAQLAQLGPRAGDFVNLESEFLLYGEDTDDPRPTRLAELLRAAGLRAAVLEGGYAAWARDPKRPRVEIVEATALAARLGIGQVKGREQSRPEPIVLFDLREDWDFARGHLPGALSLPSHRFANELAARLATTEQSQPILAFYCYGRECIRSRDCAVIAAQRGFSRLLWLRGGIEEWQAEGLPIEKEKAPESSSGAS